MTLLLSSVCLCLQDKNVLEKFNALDQASTLQFMGSTNIEGTVFQRYKLAKNVVKNAFANVYLAFCLNNCVFFSPKSKDYHHANDLKYLSKEC